MAMTEPTGRGGIRYHLRGVRPVVLVMQVLTLWWGAVAVGLAYGCVVEGVFQPLVVPVLWTWCTWVAASVWMWRWPGVELVSVATVVLRLWVFVGRGMLGMVALVAVIVAVMGWVGA